MRWEDHGSGTLGVGADRVVGCGLCFLGPVFRCFCRLYWGATPCGSVPAPAWKSPESPNQRWLCWVVAWAWVCVCVCVQSVESSLQFRVCTFLCSEAVCPDKVLEASHFYLLPLTKPSPSPLPHPLPRCVPPSVSRLSALFLRVGVTETGGSPAITGRWTKIPSECKK